MLRLNWPYGVLHEIQVQYKNPLQTLSSWLFFLERFAGILRLWGFHIEWGFSWKCAKKKKEKKSCGIKVGEIASDFEATVLQKTAQQYLDLYDFSWYLFYC